MVGGYRIAKQRKDSGALDIADRLRLGGHSVEIRWLTDIGGLGVPGEGVARRRGKVPPALVALEHIGVAAGEHLTVDRGGDGVVDLPLRRPDVLQEHVVASVVGAQWIGLEIKVHGAGNAVGDHQWRGGQIVHLDVGGDTSLKVAIARQYRRH